MAAQRLKYARFTGAQAALDGKTEADNPYLADELRDSWLLGYRTEIERMQIAAVLIPAEQLIDRSDY